MNVLVISHLFPSKIRPSNGTFVLQQIKALQKEGVNVTVVCPIPFIPKWLPLKTIKWKEFQLLPKFENFNGIEVYYLRGLSLPKKILMQFRGFFYYASLHKKLKKLVNRKRIEIIHAHTIIPDGHIATYLKKKLKIPMCVTIHGADILKFLNEEKYVKLISKVFDCSDNTIVVSEKLYQMINFNSTLKKYTSKIKIIFNGINLYKSYNIKILEKYPNEIKFITIAALIEQKGFYLVLHSLAKLKAKDSNFLYIIIGKGEAEKNIKQKINSLGLKENVIFTGELDHKEAMSYLKSSDIFVMPSKRESFGIVYLESMYFGKITIGSKNEGIDGTILDGINGYLIDPNDQSQLDEKLFYICSNFKSLDFIRKNAHETAWPKFSWKNNAKEYKKTYNEILNRV